MAVETRCLTPADLESYKSLGSLMFPGEDWETGINRVAGILARWKTGIYGAWLDGKLAAYITLYPITAEAANRLQNGTLTDAQIDSEVLPPVVGPGWRFWICTSVVITVNDPAVRAEIRDRLVGFLFERLKSHSPCEVYAHAVTPSGRRFCARLGFQFDWPAIPDLCCLRNV